MRNLRWMLLAAVFVVIGALAVARPAVAAPACPALQYIDLVERAGAALEAVPPDAAAATAALRTARAAQPESAGLLQPVLSDLQLSPPALTDAQSRLQQLDAVLAVPPRSTCTVQSAPAIAALHDVYSSPALAHLDAQPAPSLLQQIGAAIATAVSHLLGLLGTGGSVALGAVVAALLVALVAWRIRVSVVRRPAAVDEPAEPGDDPAAEWRAALNAADRSAYREAVRRAFRSALLDVAIRGRIRFDAAWTTRELLAAVHADAALLAALAPAASAFDRAWYSGRPVTQEDWETARSRCEHVRALAANPVPAGER